MTDVRKLIADTILENSYDEDDGEDWMYMATAIQDALTAAGLVIVPKELLKKLLHAKGDHMTACDKTMGDTHPCTCGANALRAMVGAAHGE
jgi:hypothetical protein